MGTNYEYHFYVIVFILLLYSFCDIQVLFSTMPIFLLFVWETKFNIQKKRQNQCLHVVYKVLESQKILDGVVGSIPQMKPDFVLLMSSAWRFVFRERYIRCVGQWEEAWNDGKCTSQTLSELNLVIINQYPRR